MLSISNDQAYERAYHLKMHQKKLEEIRKKANTLDNQLSPPFHSLAKKRQGYREIWWSEKINRENKLLLEKLIQIKQHKHRALRSLQEIKSVKQKDLQVENEMMIMSIAKVTPSFSTKNILKDYSKYRDYSNMRSKITSNKILSLKNLEKKKLPSLSYDYGHRNQIDSVSNNSLQLS